MNHNKSTLQTVFLMETHLGHRSYYQNLRTHIDPLEEIDPRWVEVTYTFKNRIKAPSPKLLRVFYSTLSCLLEVNWGLWQRPYDVAVFNTQVPAALNWFAINAKPYILCTDITPLQYDRMGEHYHHASSDSKLSQDIKYRINRRIFRNASCIIPWSNWAKSSLMDDYGVAESKISVIPPGVNTAVWKPGASRSVDRPLRLLFVGGDFYRKGGDLLIEAFRTFPKGSVELILVTRDVVAKEEGISIYRNFQPNAPELIALYQTCDVFVLPTRGEAFGISAVEAGAAGLPAIATRVGGLIDIIADGETGFLIEPDDVQALIDRISLILRDAPLREKMGLAARKRVEEQFDAQKNAMKVFQCIQSSFARSIYLK